MGEILRKAWESSRAPRRERGYGPEWDKLRLQILDRDGKTCQCEECKASGVVRLATEVDHIISKAIWRARYGNEAGVDDPSNLQAINRDCHKRKTLLEQGKSPRQQIGLDGWPI